MRSDDVADKSAKRTKKGPGRPKLELDAEAIRSRARDGAPVREIARALGCDEKVIRNHFKDAYERGRDERRQEIRNLQMKACRALNPALLIWYGKNELEQTDKVGHEHEGKLTIEVVYRDAPRTTDA
jgi:DNA-binding CsgD family transcriptional regulator